jgi:effector-binding domain-containing protein
MQIETVQTKSQPMLYVSKTSTMVPDDIGKAMGEAFDALGRFVGAHQVPVVGPPLAIYRDYSAGGVTMDVGFPVAASAVDLADGEIKAGETPGGKALKAVHRGSYDTLRQTYDALGRHMAESGIPTPRYSWEVYLNEPGTTSDADLVTEIFMPVE